jgi:hypothetical protein
MSESVDVHITLSGEFMLGHAEGLTDLGSDVIDSYMVTRAGGNMIVVDSGRIILADDDLPAFRRECDKRGLVIVETAATV